MSLTLNLKFDWKAALPVIDFHPKNALFNGKTLFMWLANTGVEPPFSKISQLKLQKLRKVHCSKFSLEFNSIRIAAHKERPALKHGQIHEKSEFHPCAVFSTRAQGSVMPNENFALSRINKDELTKLFKSENNSRYQHCRWFFVGR